MTCDTPLTDEELSLALDGLADDKTKQHLAECSICAARLADLRKMETFLQKRLRRFACPSPQTLTDYHAGILDPDAAAVRQHLERCPRCQGELEILEQFLGLPPEEESIPDNIIPMGLPKQVRLATRVETLGSLALKGGKGEGDETAHDMKAGSASVLLESKIVPKGILLTGQILDSEVDWVNAIAEMWQEGAPQKVRLLDAMCEFQFEFDKPEPIDLYITSTGGISLVVKDIVIET